LSSFFHRLIFPINVNEELLSIKIARLPLPDILIHLTIKYYIWGGSKMKNNWKCDYKKRAGLILAASALLAYPVLAADAPSVERGKELFNSAKLGTNGKSCATCHPDGKKLQHAAAYNEGELGEVINQCIKNPLKGKPLDVDSIDMKSLIIYIKTFAGPGKL